MPQTINSKKYPAVLNIEQIKGYIEGDLGRNPKTTYAWINRLIEFGLFERISHGNYLIKNYKYLTLMKISPGIEFMQPWGHKFIFI